MRMILSFLPLSFSCVCFSRGLFKCLSASPLISIIERDQKSPKDLILPALIQFDPLFIACKEEQRQKENQNFLPLFIGRSLVE